LTEGGDTGKDRKRVHGGKSSVRRGGEGELPAGAEVSSNNVSTKNGQHCSTELTDSHREKKRLVVQTLLLLKETTEKKNTNSGSASHSEE